MTARQTEAWAIWLAIAVICVHWLNQFTGTYGVMFDEAQYWLWGKLPDWGYYSKPPVIGWLIGLSTSLLGDDMLGVKAFAPLLHALTALTLYGTARQLGENRAVGAWVGITYITLPIISGASFFFTADTPLLLCWALALYSFIRALQSGLWRWWVAAGLAAGFGLLSKYTMGAFAFSAALALLLTQPRALCSVKPWAAAVVAATVFLPNLLWNMAHQFATVGHTQENLLSKSLQLYPLDWLEFTGGQLGVFGPILLIALLLTLRRSTSSTTHTTLLHCFIWPLLLAGMLVSLVAGAQAHWVSPAYLAALLIVVPWLYEHARAWLKASLALHLFILGLFYSTPALLPHLPLKHDPLERLFVWGEIAPWVQEMRARYADATLMSDERKIAAALTYALRDDTGKPHIVYKWNETGRIWDHYDLLTREANPRLPFLVISRHVRTEPQMQLVATSRQRSITFYAYRIEDKQDANR